MDIAHSSVVVGAVGALIGGALGMVEAWSPEQVELIVAGALGGVVSWAFQEAPGLRPRALALVAGGALGFYISPLLASLFFSVPSRQDGLAFFLGFLGLPLLAGVHRLADGFSRRPLEALMRFMGRGSQGGQDDG